MKNWKTPVVSELDVCLTASQGVKSTVEAAGYMYSGGWMSATYDGNTYERVDADCYLPAKGASQS